MRLAGRGTLAARVLEQTVRVMRSCCQPTAAAAAGARGGQAQQPASRPACQLTDLKPPARLTRAGRSPGRFSGRGSGVGRRASAFVSLSCLHFLPDFHHVSRQQQSPSPPVRRARRRADGARRQGGGSTERKEWAGCRVTLLDNDDVYLEEKAKTAEAATGTIFHDGGEIQMSRPRGV